MVDNLRIAGVIKESITDGPGIRLVVFAQGCKHNCPGCHNPDTHSPDGGKLVSIESILEIIRKNPLLDGITLSGGEPFEQAEGFSVLAMKSKLMGLHIMIYTGYTYEEIDNAIETKPEWNRLLEYTDILVDGRFDIKRKNILLKFRGSDNQRLIDVKQTRAEKRIVLAE